MDIQVVEGDIRAIEADAIAISVFQGVAKPDGAAAAVDEALGGVIGSLVAKGDVSGKHGEVTLLFTMGKVPAGMVAILGLGKKDEFTPERLRRANAELCRALCRARAGNVATVVHGAGARGVNHEVAAQVLAEGSVLGTYAFRKYRAPDPDQKELKELRLVECEQIHVPSVERGCRRGRIVAEAANVARDMVNEPGNAMTPVEMADRAARLAAQRGLGFRVLERQQMADLGMGALLGVAQGSDQPPKLIVLSYRGDPASSQTMGWVGKGITFDTGGISIKPAEGMGEMKGDMAGGAAVIAAMAAVAQLGPKLNITALVPAAENMPSGRALKPGDVLKAMNGKSIEIVTTDAEGRLILADALAYAVTLGLAPLVDLATLTGACHVALGEVCSGAFANNDDLLRKVVASGEQAGECLWPMPMLEDYRDQIKSAIADIRNSGGRWGGAISGALFLSEFVGGTPWVHLDIAGTARVEKDRGYVVAGGTGVGVRTLVNLASSWGDGRQT